MQRPNNARCTGLSKRVEAPPTSLPRLMLPGQGVLAIGASSSSTSAEDVAGAPGSLISSIVRWISLRFESAHEARNRAGALLMLTWDHRTGTCAPLRSAEDLERNTRLGDVEAPILSDWLSASRPQRHLDRVAVELLCQNLAQREPLSMPEHEGDGGRTRGHDGELVVVSAISNPRPDDRRRPSRKLGPRGKRLCAAAGSINLKSSFGRGVFGGTSVKTVDLPRQADANEDAVYRASLGRLEACLRSKVAALEAEAHLEAHRLGAARIREEAKHPHFRTLLEAPTKRRMPRQRPGGSGAEHRVLGSEPSDGAQSLASGGLFSAPGSRRQASDLSICCSDDAPTHISMPRVRNSDSSASSAAAAKLAATSAASPSLGSTGGGTTAPSSSKNLRHPTAPRASPVSDTSPQGPVSKDSAALELG